MKDLSEILVNRGICILITFFPPQFRKEDAGVLKKIKVSQLIAMVKNSFLSSQLLSEVFENIKDKRREI